MNLLGKIRKRELEFDPNELFDISDTGEIINNNYNAIVNELQILKDELANSVDINKNYNINIIILKYEKYKDALSELCKVFNNSKINYSEKLNLLLSLRISYQIRNESIKVISFLKQIEKNNRGNK